MNASGQMLVKYATPGWTHSDKVDQDVDKRTRKRGPSHRRTMHQIKTRINRYLDRLTLAEIEQEEGVRL